MKLTLDKRTLAIAVVSSLFFGSVPTDAVETDNINGIHTVYAGDHFADRFDCGFFCLGGPNWGNNGQQAWYVKVTFSESAATYSGGSCFADTVEYYDWNKLWGKARCGYSHSHQQDSDRIVWRRLQNLHSAPNCGGLSNCSGIQLATYSYDAGTKPYPDENWALSKVFSTIVQPNVAHILGMESFPDGSVVNSLYSSNWTLLETKTNQHSNLCANYEQGSVNGLYFGGSCKAPVDISVLYETAEVPPEPTTSSPSKSPSIAPSKPPTPPTNQPSKSPTKSPVTNSPSSRPSSSPTKSPVTSSPSKSPSLSPVTSSPVTSDPTVPQTDTPTIKEATNSPSSRPSSSPTKSPMAVTYVDKYVCAKNDPGDTEICSVGTVVGGECTTNGSGCGKNLRKTCFVVPCSSSGPSPTPAPATQAPTPTGGEPPNACPKCGDGNECCPSVGTCETQGKPSSRNCISNSNRLRRRA